jgi:thiosulfate/3-mercaptopyruvate sulfurtransferase
MSQEKTIKTTTDIDSLRSEIRDKSVCVVDVRREEDYKKNHIPTAVNLPLANLLSDDSPDRVLKLFNSLGIDDETSVVVYDDTFGALASRVAWTLEYIGHSDVSLLETTYSKWKSLGLENETQTPEIQSKQHSLNLKPEILATSDYLEQSKEKDGVVLIDNRERLNYLEQHIPGAINIPYRTLAKNDKILRPKDDMKRLLENRSIPENSEIITYCGSVGTLSGLAYYALKSIGLPNVKLYVRSFKEWKNLQKPIAKQEDASYWDLSAE